MGATVCASVLAATLAWSGQAFDRVSCQSDIVSSTVVATFCGHALDGNQVLDLLIYWRGRPGWFYRRDGAGGGGGQFGGGTKGTVSQYTTYGEVTIGFDADFDAETVKINDVIVPLTDVNTVIVDGADEPGARRISATRRTEIRLPLVGDVNLWLVQRSRTLLNDLRCDIPMPAPPSTIIPQMPIVTVCEKLRRR